jgi:hypothetical protein
LQSFERAFGVHPAVLFPLPADLKNPNGYNQ